MNDPNIKDLMQHIHKWACMPLADAKQEMRLFAIHHGADQLDLELIDITDDFNEAVCLATQETA